MSKQLAHSFGRPKAGWQTGYLPDGSVALQIHRHGTEVASVLFPRDVIGEALSAWLEGDPENLDFIELGMADGEMLRMHKPAPLIYGLLAAYEGREPALPVHFDDEGFIVE